MPTYDYGCATCGPFSESHPMAEFARPQPCPACGDPSPRLLTAPALGGNASPQAAPMQGQRMHPGGCACCAAPRRLAAEAV